MAETTLQATKAVTAIGTEHGGLEGGYEAIAAAVGVDARELNETAAALFADFGGFRSANLAEQETAIRIFRNAFCAGVHWADARG